MAAGMKQLSKTFVWILMGMLIVGLAGFGAVNFSSSLNSVALVGDEEVSVQAYARELQREQRSIQEQTGAPVPMSQLTALGVDRAVLGRLISLAAIDNEVAQLGISIGDENLLKELTEIGAFQNASGKFDRNAYKFALENAGLNEGEFENDLRRESARTLVQGAVMSGVSMPETMTKTITDFIGARRSFSYVQLSEDQLALIQLVPDDADLKAFYDANPDQFTLPETKVITYALLSPQMLVDEVEVDDAALRKLYEDRADTYQQPERRLVERLVFANDDAAATAKAQLEVGGNSFETLVSDRQLTLQDVDMGDVTMADLGDAAEAVFSAQVGEVVGPLPTSLGPALFRINGRLEARFTPFETAEAELREELAADRARRLVEQQAEGIDDLMAGGATIEELADEAGLEVASLNWTGAETAGIAAYEGFREAAQAVTSEDFPTVEFLGDGSLFALRLDETLPERPEPFDAAKQRVLDAWNADRLSKALTEQAEALLKETRDNGAFPEGYPVKTETGVTRTAYIDTTPADMMNQVFEMQTGDLRLVIGDGSAVVLQLDEILSAEETAEMALLAQALKTQLDQALSQALFEAFVIDAQTRAAPRVDQQALNAVQANFQ